MKYKLQITKIAERDLETAADYIEFILKNPTAADHLYDLAIEKISSLSSSPKIHPVVDDPILGAWGIRFIVINNYLAFYSIDETHSTVYILRFLYKKRNWVNILKQDFE